MMRRENSEDEQPPPPEQPRAQEEIAGSCCSPHVLRVADFSHERAAAERDGLDSTRSSCSSKRELEPSSVSEELQLACGAASASDTLAAPPPSKRQQSWGATSLVRALPEAVDEEQGQGHEQEHALKARAGADLAHAAAGAADAAGEGVQVFRAEWDAEGVYFYQAFSDEIAEWALREQRLGGPKFNETRMTWIKPSFAWVLYRSGYGRKHRQERILKLKLPHSLVAELLCDCVQARRRRLQGARAVGPRARPDVLRGQARAERLLRARHPNRAEPRPIRAVRGGRPLHRRRERPRAARRRAHGSGKSAKSRRRWRSWCHSCQSSGRTCRAARSGARQARAMAGPGDHGCESRGARPWAPRRQGGGWGICVRSRAQTAHARRARTVPHSQQAAVQPKPHIRALL